MIATNPAALTIDSSTVAGGVTITHTGAANPNITVHGSTISTTSGYAIRVTDAALLPSDFTGNTLAGAGIHQLGFDGALAQDWSLTEADAGTIVGTLTIPAGQSRAIAAGSTVGFASGAGLSVNGTLNAPGTLASPAALVTAAGATGWAGVSLGDGATVTGTHLDVSGASTALTAPRRRERLDHRRLERRRRDHEHRRRGTHDRRLDDRRRHGDPARRPAGRSRSPARRRPASSPSRPPR